jgi:hypothetical protein
MAFGYPAQTAVTTPSGVARMESSSSEMIEWFDQFHRAFQCMRSLREDDPRYYEAFERLVVCHRVWCGHNGSVSLRVWPRVLEVNGTHLQIADSRDSIQWFHDRCRKRAMEELLFLGMLAPHDFQVFMTLMLQDRSLFEDADFPSSFLLAQQVSLIQVNPPNVEDSFFGAAPFQIDTLDLSKLPREERPNPVQTSALHDAMSSEESQELHRQTLTWIEKDQREAIHNCIAHLRSGLENQFREVQVRGYVGLRVVVTTLIEQRQTQILYAVLKAFPKMVAADASADLLAFHLETFSAVMTFFQEQQKIRPLVFAFEWLANWRFHAKQPLSQLATELLDQHFEPDVIAQIATLQQSDPVLAEHWKKLLTNYPRALAKPLLFYLYDSEEKTFRELLLDVLKGVMSHISGDVTREVHRAMERKAPWYIKRNLLTLLQEDPPASLSPLLVRMLGEESQPQLREMLYSCAFKLHTPKLQRLCDQALNQLETEAEILPFIEYIRAGKQPHYVGHLRRFFRKALSDEVSQAAIQAMAVIGGSEALASLDRVLSHRSLFTKRAKVRLRRYAAEALKLGDDPELRRLAERFATDRDDVVRQACRSVLRDQPAN